MTLDPDNLKRLAQAAHFPLSPWTAEGGTVYGRDRVGRTRVVTRLDPSDTFAKDVAAFIAACSPDVVLELVALVETHERAVEITRAQTASHQEAREQLSAERDALRERVATLEAVERAQAEALQGTTDGAIRDAERIAELEAELAGACDRCQDRIAERRKRGDHVAERREVGEDGG